MRCGAATESQQSVEPGLGEDFDERSGEDEIVLDVVIGSPRRNRAPMGDEGGRNHTSGSTRVLTSTRQR